MSMSEFTVINAMAGATFIGTPDIDFDDMLDIARNGIGLRFTVPMTGSEDFDIYSFRRKSVRPAVLPEDEYVFIRIDYVTDTFRTTYIKVGPTVTAGHIYTVTCAGIEVRYTALPGDTSEDVRDALVVLMNAETYPAASTATISGVYLDEFTFHITNPSYPVTVDIIFGTKYLFQTGYFVTLNIGAGNTDYLILLNESNTDYPSLPGLSTYDFDDLIETPSGIRNYLNVPMYTEQSYSTTNEGAQTITDFPGTGSIPAGWAAYDEVLQRIYFAESLNAGEYIKGLYRS